MKKIIINEKAVINANGNLSGGHCVPVICLNDGGRFTSVTDAAEHAGVTAQYMCNHLKGKTRTCKGKRYCYLYQLAEKADVLMDRLSQVSAMEEDARRWREHQAEQEAIRLAEERRLEEERRAEERKQAEIAKLLSRRDSLTHKLDEINVKRIALTNDIAEVELALVNLGVMEVDNE